MSELWVFRGTQPVIWRLPVTVTLKKPAELTGDRLRRAALRVHFEPAVRLLDCQRTALDNFFARQKTVELALGHWRFKYSQQNYIDRLAAMGGVRATSDDPEDHLVWGARRPPPGKLKPDQKERREWLEDLMGRGVGDSIEQLEYLWRSFCLHIAHTLINQEQPVDFHWFKLHNCPLRTGWHESTDLDYRKPPKEPKNILRRVMGDDKMLAFDVAGEHCLRHIEIEHTDGWWKLIRKVEGQRRYKLGYEGYARKYQHSLERFALTAWRLHCRWYQEMAQDGLCRVAYGPGGGFRFVWDPLARGVRRAPYKRGKAPFRANLRHLKNAIARVAQALPRAHGRVPAVSDLRPAEEAVRQPADDGNGPAVDKPGDSAGGSDGVFLPTQLQELAPASEVLAPRTGSDERGLAGGT